MSGYTPVPCAQQLAHCTIPQSPFYAPLISPTIIEVISSQIVIVELENKVVNIFSALSLSMSAGVDFLCCTLYIGA